MKIRVNPWILLILTLSLYSLLMIESTKEIAVSQQTQSSQSTGEYYPHHPTGCRYIKKLEIEHFSGYYFIQPCSRDDRMWLQQITVTETRTTGVIYVQEQSLVNGLKLSSAYWCSLQAPGFKNVGPAGVCTKDGWRPNKR